MADRAVWQRTIVDERGNIIPGAEVTVRSYPGGSLVPLYESPEGAPKSNPFVTGPDGFARFWARSQRAEIVARGAGSTIRWIVDLINADEVIGGAVAEATAAAEAAVGEAEAAADRAEVARDAAQLNARIYPTTSAGLAATTDGDYFSVPSSDDDEYLILYRNDNGSAAEVRRYPSTQAIDRKAPLDLPVFTGGISSPLVRIHGAAVRRSDGGFAVEDEDGNRVFEIGPDGAARMVQAILDAVRTIETSAERVSVGESSLTEGEGWPWAITDREGNVLFGMGEDLVARMLSAYVGAAMLEAAPEGWKWAVGDAEGNILCGVTDDAKFNALGLPDPQVIVGDRLAVALRGTPVLWDDFKRAYPYPTSGLGMWSSGWRWHDSDAFRATETGATLSESASPGRNFAQSGHLIKEYAWRMVVGAEGDFDLGWSLRVPDLPSDDGPRLYCSFSRQDDVCAFRLYFTASGSDDASADILAEAEWEGAGKGRFEFAGIVDGDVLDFYCDGRRVTTYQLGAAQNAALGHGFGVNARSGAHARIHRVEVYRLYERPSVYPTIISHRMVVDGPFGTGAWFGRDPECCLSALERLPHGVGIELDVRGTADGGLILMHDGTVDRTTYGTGAPYTMTTEEATSLRIRGLGGRTVPTLQGLLAALEDRPDIPEILVQYYSGGVENVVSAINQADPSVSARCLVFVSSVSEAEAIRVADPSARICVGGRRNDNLDELPDLVNLGVELALISPGDAPYFTHRGIIPNYKSAGIRIGASTTGSHWTFRQIIEDEADVVLSDYPATSMR